MLAQGTAARFKFTLHPYYCWSRLSTSCLLHETSKGHVTRCCWPWCFRAWRGSYGSFPRGRAVIPVRPYWLRCVSAPRSPFVLRRPLSALARIPFTSTIPDLAPVLRSVATHNCTIAQNIDRASSHTQSQTAIGGSFTDCTCPVCALIMT
jgi:hypothetical protein